MFGANNSATMDGGLLQLRALDWNVDGMLNYPTLNILKNPINQHSVKTFLLRYLNYRESVLRYDCKFSLPPVIYRPIQELPSDYSLPPQGPRAPLCQHWVDWMDWVHYWYVRTYKDYVCIYTYMYVFQSCCKCLHWNQAQYPGMRLQLRLIPKPSGAVLESRWQTC